MRLNFDQFPPRCTHAPIALLLESRGKAAAVQASVFHMEGVAWDCWCRRFNAAAVGHATPGALKSGLMCAIPYSSVAQA